MFDQQTLMSVLRKDQREAVGTEPLTNTLERYARGARAMHPEVEIRNLYSAGNDCVRQSHLVVELQRTRLDGEGTRCRARFRSLVDDPNRDAVSRQPQREDESGRTSSDDQDERVIHRFTFARFRVTFIRRVEGFPHPMPMTPADQSLLEALLDSWDRNNTILNNLLRAIPESALDLTPSDGSPSILRLFRHIHGTRLFFVSEDAPEFALQRPDAEAMRERNPRRIAEMLNESAKAVRDAVKSRVESGRGMNVRYDHPNLMLQHQIWHEGYHHGQIKLTLKLAKQALADEEIGPVTWDVWMDKA